MPNPIASSVVAVGRSFLDRITVVTSALFSSFVFVGCMPAVVDVKSEALSPDGLSTVAVYTSDVGATSSVLTVVNIRPSRVSFEDREVSGNVFAGSHAGQVDAVWRSNDELFIRVHGEPRVSLQVIRLWDTKVSYEGKGVEK